jgi:hypothetical protein
VVNLVVILFGGFTLKGKKGIYQDQKTNVGDNEILNRY